MEPHLSGLRIDAHDRHRCLRCTVQLPVILPPHHRSAGDDSLDEAARGTCLQIPMFMAAEVSYHVTVAALNKLRNLIPDL